jgi:hypothetical protein
LSDHTRKTTAGTAEVEAIVSRNVQSLSNFRTQRKSHENAKQLEEKTTSPKAVNTEASQANHGDCLVIQLNIVAHSLQLGCDVADDRWREERSDITEGKQELTNIFKC